ncbi:unnamed protein product [Merluccius merluccius]
MAKRSESVGRESAKEKKERGTKWNGGAPPRSRSPHDANAPLRSMDFLSVYHDPDQGPPAEDGRRGRSRSGLISAAWMREDFGPVLCRRAVACVRFTAGRRYGDYGGIED